MKNALASGRRILLAVLAAVLLFGGWVAWKAPTLNELRPQLETLLARQFGLKQLKLGHLSWRWAGNVWLRAQDITFVGAGKLIAVEDAQLEVRLSSIDLIRGKVRPTSISLRHGRIELHIPKAAAGEAFPLPAGQLHIEDSTVTLNYGELSNRFEHLELLLDADHRTLGMRLPGFALDVRWNPQLQPEKVLARFDNLLWLPEEWRCTVSGAFSARLQLDKVAGRQDWALAADISSDSGMRLRDAHGHTYLPVNEVHAEAGIQAGANPLDITAVDWKKLSLQAGDNQLRARGRWTDGQLTLHLDAPQLDVPTLAGIGMPMAGAEWQSWLAGLEGRMSDVNIDLHVTQATPWSTPELAGIQRGDVTATARLHDVAVPLLAPGEVLREWNGSLTFDASGLLMQADSLLLPYAAGRVKGQARIDDFSRPVFRIDGQGMVDLGLIQKWMQVDPLPQVAWKSAPAESSFHLEWPMFAMIPDKGEARLVPQPEWQAEILGRPVRIKGGSMSWSAADGVHFNQMHIAYENLGGVFDLTVQQSAPQTSPQTVPQAWRITSLHLDSSGDFTTLAGRLRMPMDEPKGSYHASMVYDAGRDRSPWSFELDLKDAGWEGLLGSRKNPGEPYALLASGSQSDKGITLSRLHSKGGAPVVAGSGELSPQMARLQLSVLRAAAFSGSLSIRAPLGEASDAPLEIEVHSDFLDQRALPMKLPDMTRLESAPAQPAAPHRRWVLRGDFARVHWDAVSIRGVHVYFASATQGIGRLEADALDAAQFSMQDVRAYFRLSSGGLVDVRHLGARVLGQQMNLSGTLQPEPGGGLRWRGFADVNGDFSQLIHRLDAAKLFSGGMLHAHWSGTGVIREGKPWWNDMQGRLRLRSDDGRILEGGTMTKLLAALSLADLPGFLTGSRKDITGPGMLYKRLQIESTVHGETADIRRLAMRASALDLAGRGSLNLADGSIDLYVVARPLQNLDALLNMIPLLRDVILGPAKSVFRKVYHVHGPLHNATVEAVSAEQAGLPESGLLEQLLSLPGRWFDAGRKAAGEVPSALP